MGGEPHSAIASGMMTEKQSRVHFDTTQPVSLLLRTGTIEAHQKIEMSAGAVSLATGQLPREEYIKYLFSMWHLYDALEAALGKHSAHPTISAIYHPQIHSRAGPIAEDIAYLLQASPEPVSWQWHPAYLAFLPLPHALAAYISHLQNIPDPVLLVAHAYVRYLGDMSGGQVIKRRIQKAYHLEEDDGTKFYDFYKAGSDTSVLSRATSGDIAKMKGAFRDGMDAGIQDDTVKVAVAQEAILAFEMNAALLTNLQPGVAPIPPGKAPRTTASETPFFGLLPSTWQKVLPVIAISACLIWRSTVTVKS